MTHRLLLFILALVVAAPALGQGLTWIEPPVSYDNTYATGVSGNGQVVLVYYNRGIASDGAMGGRWTREEGLVNLVPSGYYVQSLPSSASHDGSVLAGYAYRTVIWPISSSSHAVLWGPGTAGTPTSLVTIGNGTTNWTPDRGKWIVSDDGLTVVGTSNSCWDTGGAATYFRWNSSTGAQPLDLPPGEPIAVNRDATVIVGNGFLDGAQDYQAYRWTEETGAVAIMPGFLLDAANADCSVLVGQVGGATYRLSSGGESQRFGALQGHPWGGGRAEALDVSDDGAVIVGRLVGQAVVGAFLWTPSTGLWDLNGLLPRMGLHSTRWLEKATGVSADGRTIVGTSLSGGLWKGFVLTIPQCSSADFDNDGHAGADADIEAFFACLAGNCCSTCWWLGADVDSDGDTGTDADIEAFFRVLGGAGC